MTGRRTKNNKKKGFFLKAGYFFYIGFCLFSTVWLRSEVVNLEYELGDLDRLRTELKIEKEMIVAQRANFFSMGNVEKVALKRLGMSHADREKIYFVSSSSVAGPYRASVK